MADLQGSSSHAKLAFLSSLGRRRGQSVIDPGYMSRKIRKFRIFLLMYPGSLLSWEKRRCGRRCLPASSKITQRITNQSGRPQAAIGEFSSELSAMENSRVEWERSPRPLAVLDSNHATSQFCRRSTQPRDLSGPAVSMNTTR